MSEMMRMCGHCKGDGGGWIRKGADDWEWLPCADCGGVGDVPVKAAEHKVVGLMQALEESVREAKAARRDTESGDRNG